MYVVICLALATAEAIANVPLEHDAPLTRTTSKSLQQFAECFVAAQKAAAHPWWFVPKESGGGTFSDLGAANVINPYFLDFGEGAPVNTIRLYWTDPGAATDPLVTLAVYKCA